MTRRVNYCDFCNCDEPHMTWSVEPGGKVSLYGVDITTGRALMAVHDKDGFWVACETCHQLILDYKAAKVKPSALRRFHRLVMKRCRWQERFGGDTVVLQDVVSRLKTLYKGVLPKLCSFEPFTTIPNGSERLESIVNPSAGEATFVPPSHIPDGSSRGRSF